MATRFQGEHTCKLDAKGRIMFPARMKGALPEVNTKKIVLRKGFEPCLELYPYEEWEKISSQFDELNSFDEQARKLGRSFFRGVEEVEMDVNFRFLIPKKFINDLKFKKEVVMIGVKNRVEIWDSAKLDEFVVVNDEFNDLATKLMYKGEKS